MVSKKGYGDQGKAGKAPHAKTTIRASSFEEASHDAGKSGGEKHNPMPSDIDREDNKNSDNEKDLDATWKRRSRGKHQG